MRREIEKLKSATFTLDECEELLKHAERDYEFLTGTSPYNLAIERAKSEAAFYKRVNDELAEEISNKNKIIISLTDYIAVLQKGRTPIVFTAAKDELKDVQEFIAKHVL